MKPIPTTSSNRARQSAVGGRDGNNRQPSTVGGRRAVFLDRDGVINRMVYNPDFGTVDSPANPTEFTLLPGVGKAIASFNELGFGVIVVSNQPGIAKGKFSPALLDAMTQKMLAGVEADGGKIEAIHYCLHHPQSALAEYRVACDCRKPKPGLLTTAARELGINLEKSFMVGDGITDVLAGQAAGAQTILISSRKCYLCDAVAKHRATTDFLAADLTEAVEILRMVDAGDHLSAAKYRLPYSMAEVYSPSDKTL